MPRGRWTAVSTSAWLVDSASCDSALARLAPETRGGGADAVIEAFHQNKGIVRRRVPFLKAIVSIFTLGFGGSGGREGPTMQMSHGRNGVSLSPLVTSSPAARSGTYPADLSST